MFYLHVNIKLGVHEDPVATGRWGAVVWAVDASGRAPALEFFLRLSDEEAAKIEGLFELLAESGWIANVEKFKKLDDISGQAIWEFKSFQIRFLGGFVPGGRFVVAHGVKKKKNKHKSSDLDRTARILNAHLSRQAGGGRQR